MAWRSSGLTNRELIQNLATNGIIRHENVKQAMMQMDRRHFCPHSPYEDSPQSIGHNATISAPHMHAYALEALHDFLRPGNKCLDIGSGTGYLTCCMAEMVGKGGKAIGVEHIDPLVKQSIKNVRNCKPEYLNEARIELHTGDGRKGWVVEAPYDAIHVGAAAYPLPKELIDQLKSPGRLIVPVGPESGFQYLTQIDKDKDGSIHQKKLMGVRYVPLTSRENQLGA